MKPGSDWLIKAINPMTLSYRINIKACRIYGRLFIFMLGIFVDNYGKIRKI
jgi:hypothetical protein